MNREPSSLVLVAKHYIAERGVAKLEAFDKESKKLFAGENADKLASLESQRFEKRAVLESQFDPCNWISVAAAKAGQISMVTHAPKYTHSDTKSAGVLCGATSKSGDIRGGQYLSSESCLTLPLDVVGNAAALDVATFLQLSVDGRSILDEIISGESPTLSSLASSGEQTTEWLLGFTEALNNSELKTGQLAKQLYFPVEGGYRLIAPLYATSLSQLVHERLAHHFYSEPSKQARKARKQGQFHSSDAVIFLGVARQAFGGTKPQNISLLNSRRGGSGYLFSSRPPTWENRDFLPQTGKYAFWRQLERQSWGALKTLRSYLEKVINQNNSLKIRSRREELVDEVVGGLLRLAAEIQQQQSRAGWSASSDLDVAEQLWLDPFRAQDDESFKELLTTSDWQAEVADQFATWLNNKLSYRSDDLYTGDAEYAEWKKMLKRKLQLLKYDLEDMA